MSEVIRPDHCEELKYSLAYRTWQDFTGVKMTVIVQQASKSKVK